MPKNKPFKIRYFVLDRSRTDLRVNLDSEAFKQLQHAYDTGTRVDCTGKTAAEIVEELFSDQRPDRRR